jgi:uncharacterized membrane protein YgdD (TMEM256/DUF423 family)
MTERLAAGLGALNAFLAVAAGAFGAHGLRKRLTPDLLEIFETGARYHMFHALGLFACAFLISRGVPASRPAAWLMLVGIVLFSGSLYALALSGVRGLGAVTPLGGVCFLLGWGLLAYGALVRP